MHLLELGDGNVSLEFQPAETAAVLSALQGMAGYRRERRAAHDVIKAGGGELAMTDDWEEPTLVSMDSRGAEILRLLAALDIAQGVRAASRG